MTSVQDLTDSSRTLMRLSKDSTTIFKYYISADLKGSKPNSVELKIEPEE
jgi:hypothetical protein